MQDGVTMKKYRDGGDIPQGIKNTLADRKEEKGRKKFKDMERQENEAPKKSVKNMYDRVRDMFGVDASDKPAKKTVKKAKGGYVRKADGCAQRGKTKGKMV